MNLVRSRSRLIFYCRTGRVRQKDCSVALRRQSLNCLGFGASATCSGVDTLHFNLMKREIKQY